MPIANKDTSALSGTRNHSLPAVSSTKISPHNALGAQGIQLLERRSEARYPTRDVAEVQILEKGSLCRVAATILDVSRSGLRIEVRSPIPKGSQVEIIMGRALVIFGEVRYCRRGGEAVYAGILIQQVVHPRPLTDEHIPDDVLSRYLSG